MQQSTGTELTTLPVADRAAIALASTATEKHLRELVANSSGILAVASPDERMEAHRAGMALKKARTTIKDTGKAAREDAQAFSKAVIAEEKRLIDMIQPEEDRVLSLRDRYDAEQARIKAEAERIENERKSGIKAKITALLNLVATSYRDSAAQLKATLDDLANYELTEADFAEFVGEAAEAKAQALEGLTDLHAKAVAAEAEAAKLEAERAELQRIQAEAAKARKEEEERLKAEREAFEAERRAFQAQQEAAQREREAAEKLARDHEEALAMNAVWAPAEAPAESVEAAYEAAVDEEMQPAPSYGLYAIGQIAEGSPPEMTTLDAALDGGEGAADALKAGIDALCIALQNLRDLGMDNDHILYTVGEALEAIDAKVAA